MVIREISSVAIVDTDFEYADKSKNLIKMHYPTTVVECYDNPYIALGLMNQFQPDICFIELYFNGFSDINGVLLARALRNTSEDFKYTPILVQLSGNALYSSDFDYHELKSDDAVIRIIKRVESNTVDEENEIHITNLHSYFSNASESELEFVKEVLQQVDLNQKKDCVSSLYEELSQNMDRTKDAIRKRIKKVSKKCKKIKNVEPIEFVNKLYFLIKEADDD